MGSRTMRGGSWPFWVRGSVGAIFLFNPLIALSALGRTQGVEIPDAAVVSQRVRTACPGAEVADGKFVLGDFDGDNQPDLAAVVTVKADLRTVSAAKVQVIDADPYSPSNGRPFDPTSKGALSGVMFVVLVLPTWHAGQWTGAPHLLMTESYSNLTRLDRNARLPLGVTLPEIKRRTVDGLLLATEAGGVNLILFDGKAWRGYILQAGD